MMVVVHEPVLRELQPLLRRSLGLGDLLVDEVKYDAMMPPGENYGSSILKVRARVRPRGHHSDPENWHLIAKMLPPTDFQRLIFDCDYTVPKETFFYEELFPAYQQLECEFGIKPVFDALPKFYGSRMSLKEDVKGVDEDAVILLENLKEKEYYTVERKSGKIEGLC